MKSISFLRSLNQTYSSQLIIIISGIILLKVMAIQLTKVDFGAFMVIKRIASMAFPIFTLNLGISLARYIPFKPEKARVYYLIAQGILFFTTVIAIFIIFLFTPSIARLVFGMEYYDLLLPPTLLFLYSSGFQVITVGYFRGKMDFNRMNIVNVLFAVNSLIILMLLVISKNQNLLQAYFYYYSILSIVINFLLFWSAKKSTDIHVKQNGARLLEWVGVKKFLLYGFHRLPSVLFIVSIFSIPVLYTSNRLSLELAAYIGIIVSIANIFQTLGHPFNLLILPKTADLTSNNEYKEIKEISRKTIDFFFTIPLLIIPLMVLFADDIILLWFGQNYSSAIVYLQVFSPASAFIVLYALLRGIIDGFKEYPYINIITGVSFVAMLLLFIITINISDKLLSICYSFTGGLITLGVTSLFVIKRHLKIKIFSRRNSVCMFIIIIASIFSFLLIANTDNFGFGFLSWWIIKIILATIITISMMVLYSKFKYEWLQPLKQIHFFRWL